MAMKLGSHVSSSGSLNLSLSRAESIGCECMQIFTSDPKGWNFKIRPETEIEDFCRKVKDSSIGSVYGHTIYLTNLASVNPYIYTNSINSLVSGLVFAERACFAAVVTHIGSHGGKGVRRGTEQVVKALKEALNIAKGNVMLLLEVDAGSGNHIGAKFEEIAEIIKKVGSDRVGVCFDTCHAFAAGYDISTPEKIDRVLLEFDNIIGLEKLKLLHLNDSKGELGSHLDRHEEIGKGKIGLSAFGYIVNHPKLKNICGIVETPDNKMGADADKLSLDTLKELREND
jgi:deoxyribonuclease-4